MPQNSHYSEDDVSAIFQAAIKAQEEAHRKRGRRDGLTLAELKDIGAELGITPEFIERAAAARKAEITAKPDKKILGVPVSVERVLSLPRELTDDEWGMLVADLRDTFSARGSVSQEGTLRQWTNGNLSAMTEPTPGNGWQLRLRTRKGNAESGFFLGGMFAAFGVLITVLLLLKDLPQDPSKYAFGGFFLLVALASFAFSSVTLPRWHRERSEQMEQIAGRVSAMVGEAQTTVSVGAPIGSPKVDNPGLLDLDPDVSGGERESPGVNSARRTRE